MKIVPFSSTINASEYDYSSLPKKSYNCTVSISARFISLNNLIMQAEPVIHIQGMVGVLVSETKSTYSRTRLSWT